MKKAFLLLALFSNLVFADAIYKCTNEAGKISYSNEPCVGAERIDATASRGFNKTSGRELKGASVLREEHNETMQQIFRQIDSSYNREKFRKRYQLTTQEQAQCKKLDYDIERLERLEKASKGKPELRDVQVELFQKRKAFREIDC